MRENLRRRDGKGQVGDEDGGGRVAGFGFLLLEILAVGGGPFPLPHVFFSYGN